MSTPDSRLLNYRQTEIVSQLRQAGRVAVEDLSTQFGVTLQTIRRDLNELSEAKLLVRVHGGAIIASGVANLAYEARQLVAHQHKRLQPPFERDRGNVQALRRRSRRDRWTKRTRGHRTAKNSKRNLKKCERQFFACRGRNVRCSV